MIAIPWSRYPKELAVTTTATPTAAGTILALDLGKDKSVACAYDHATFPGTIAPGNPQNRVYLIRHDDLGRVE